MNAGTYLRTTWRDMLCAVQFLTRIPIRLHAHESDTLARSVVFFPLVGGLIGACAASIFLGLAFHLPRLLSALFTLLFMVAITGALHEDGLADAADGFGGGWNREQILLIMRDSRIGTYGAVALIIGLLGRVLLLSSLPAAHVVPYIIAAHVLCRWTTLPLSLFLTAARAQTSSIADGQGARVAHLVDRRAFVAASLFSIAVVVLLLRGQAVFALLAACAVTALSGLYYQRRLGGVTGDCFGATNQLTELAVYLCGVWAA